MDRAFNGPVLVGSPDGGMDIEEVAEKTPERIFTMPIDITDGINMDQVSYQKKSEPINVEMKNKYINNA